jgi:hypothetical protein
MVDPAKHERVVAGLDQSGHVAGDIDRPPSFDDDRRHRSTPSVNSSA